MLVPKPLLYSRKRKLLKLKESIAPKYDIELQMPNAKESL